MNDWRLWIILLTTIGTLLYTIVSSYAVRGNELKHIKEAIQCLEKKLLKRIERLENLFMKNRKGE